MVYKKFIKRVGKRFGPYFYESYRDKKGHVKTRYVSIKNKDVDTAIPGHITELTERPGHSYKFVYPFLIFFAILCVVAIRVQPGIYQSIGLDKAIKFAGKMIGITGMAVTDITSCGVLNVNGNYYQLGNDLSSSAICFNITADNIVLDGNGYKINGNDVASYFGVYAYKRLNITINLLVIWM